MRASVLSRSKGAQQKQLPYLETRTPQGPFHRALVALNSDIIG